MSGETEELTNDGVSVASDLVWTDNPELAYFRSMMNERMDERIASGLDMNDSLIGDSTLHDMMDGELQMMQSYDSNSRDESSFPSRNNPQRHAAAVDTSGLSLVEDDTIDNINTEDGSILAWFSRQRKERAKQRAEEDGTLESDPAMMDVRQLDPATGVQQPLPLPLSSQHQQQVQSQPQRRFFSPLRSPPRPPSSPQYAHEDNIEVDRSIDNPSKMCIPGFIFVTSGQSSSVQTRASNSQPTKKTKASTIASGDNEGNRKRCMSTKFLILCLVLAVVIAGIMMTVIFTNNRNRSRESSSAQAPGRKPAVPLPAPGTTAPPFFSVGESSPPQEPIPSMPPTAVPLPSNGGSSSPPASASNATTLPMNTTGIPTVAPTPGQKSNVGPRLNILSPVSVDAWLNSTSPQSLARTWLVGDAGAETYTDTQLLQRYVLATLYYSTNGDNWSQGSISWVVEWSEECTWRGIQCNTTGGVRIVQLANENLSGSLPRELQLLSNSLEEVYLNGNSIGGTIPPSIGKLSKLRRLQLTGNALTGSLPASFSSLESLRNISVKNNLLTGQLPPELGSLTLLRNFDVSKNNIGGSIPPNYGNMVSLGSMYLFENRLTGTIPTTFNQLTSMTILRAEFNNIIGTMPLGLCGMDQLSVDCLDEIICAVGCCTSCCADGGRCEAMTSPPTFEPTLEPTEAVLSPIATPTIPTQPPISPTISPSTESTGTSTVLATEDSSSISTTEAISSCRASIESDRDCYEDGENIVITFENCDSTEFDWIGVYSTTTDIMDLGDPLAWVWACGDQFCNDVVDAGQAILYNARGTGSFVVYLLRSNEDLDGSFIAYGVGNAFEMSTSCG